MPSSLDALRAQTHNDELVRAAQGDRPARPAGAAGPGESPARRGRLVAGVIAQLRRRERTAQRARPVPTAHPAPEAWPDRAPGARPG